MTSNGRDSAGAFRDLRRAAGLSQEALAREVDCSTAYVQVLERGYTPADPESPVFARVMARLTNDSGAPPQDAAAKTGAGTPDGQQV